MSAPQELKGPDLAAGVDASGLKDGEPLLGHVAGEPIVLVKRQGEVCAVGAVCTHYGGPLAEGIVEGDTIRCPWHHARFDLRTGAPTRPGRDPIPCYRVERQNGLVRVGERLAPPRTGRSPCGRWRTARPSWRARRQTDARSSSAPASSGWRSRHRCASERWR